MSDPLRLAINGYGRIGRCVLRAVFEADQTSSRQTSSRFQIVAINEPAPLPALAHLTRFDSTHGALSASVSHDDRHLIVSGQPIAVWHETAAQRVPWPQVDVVLECSGQYTKRDDLQRFLEAGCPRVLLSNPGHSAADVDATVVYGINQQVLHAPDHAQDRLVSAASCTTNAIVPVLDTLHRCLNIEHVFLTTLHSAMNDQPLLDGYHNADLRYTRSGMQSFVPVPTGLARGVERLLPALHGKVLAKAIRVPTLNVSAIDAMLHVREAVTESQVNGCMQALAQAHPDLFGYTECAQASVDFNHCPLSMVFDASQTRVNGAYLLNIWVWFDNEWGFANRLLDVAQDWQKSWRQDAPCLTPD